MKRLILEEESGHVDEPALSIALEATEVDWIKLTVGYRRYRQAMHGDLEALDPPGEQERVRSFSLTELLGLGFQVGDSGFHDRGARS